MIRALEVTALAALTLCCFFGVWFFGEAQTVFEHVLAFSAVAGSLVVVVWWWDR